MSFLSFGHSWNNPEKLSLLARSIGTMQRAGSERSSRTLGLERLGERFLAAVVPICPIIPLGDSPGSEIRWIVS
jgi:hypothetical protein